MEDQDMSNNEGKGLTRYSSSLYMKGVMALSGHDILNLLF